MINANEINKLIFPILYLIYTWQIDLESDFTGTDILSKYTIGKKNIYCVNTISYYSTIFLYSTKGIISQ